MERVVTQTCSRAFQKFFRSYDFSLRFQKLDECLESSTECFKSSAMHFKTSTRPSVSLKRVYENLVSKKRRIFTGV